MLTSIISHFAGWGYLGIIILMAIESSFVPLPSELIIPPAGYLASTGNMNIWLIILSGAAGSIVGALFNYFLARHLGSPLVHRLARSRWAKYFLINPEKLAHAEQYFKDNGRSSTFFGRLVPGVRHLISIPAGLAKMPLIEFIVFTALGAGIWTAVLTVLGYWFGNNQQVLEENYKLISYAGAVLFICLAGYLLYARKVKYGKKSKQAL